MKVVILSYYINVSQFLRIRRLIYILAKIADFDDKLNLNIQLEAKNTL